MFNTALLKPNIESEHAIGMWKGRFPWLHRIPMIMKQSTEKEDLSHILEVIDTCVVLHNFLIDERRRFPMNGWMMRHLTSAMLSETWTSSIATW